MCGIAGILYTDRHRQADTSVLKSMGDAIAHRGPDGEGYLVSGPAGMVHRRLAIIDLAGGDQPSQMKMRQFMSFSMERSTTIRSYVSSWSPADIDSEPTPIQKSLCTSTRITAANS